VLVVLVLKNCELSTPELPPGMHSIVEQGFALLVLLVVKNACPAAILPEGSISPEFAATLQMSCKKRNH
jgi:hypothetical protein